MLLRATIGTGTTVPSPGALARVPVGAARFTGHVNRLLAAEPDEHEFWRVLKNRKCGSAPGGDGKFVDFYKALCAPLEGGSGRGLTQLLSERIFIDRNSPKDTAS